MHRCWVLQWGRDRAVAEFVIGATQLLLYVMASMGPRPRGRGIKGAIDQHRVAYHASMGPRPRGRGIWTLTNAHATAQIELQWGRDRAVAELRNGSQRRAGSKRFNGAATARSRNYGPAMTWNAPRPLASMGPRPRGRGIPPDSATTPKTPELQWGRDRAVAEFFLSGFKTAELLKASMGPRPRGRGINFLLMPIAHENPLLQWGRDRAVAEFRSAQAAPGAQLTLQWGRDRAVAELSASHPGVGILRALQWGRDRAVAELPASSHTLARTPAASMGPRPRGRGIG